MRRSAGRANRSRSIGWPGRTPSRDWARFERSLAQCLGLLRCHEYLILAQREGNHYVQFAVQEGGVRAEARSNVYIDGPESKLGRAACARLLALGWNPPTSLPPELRLPDTERDSGSPNFYLDQGPPARPARLARLAVRTLREVYRTRHPADLEYHAFHRDGEGVRLPLELAERAARAAPPAPGEATGIGLMLEAAHEVFPDARLEVSEHAVVVDSAAGLLSIAHQADGVLGIWALLLGAPDPGPEVYEALNVENIWLDGAKAVAVEGQLYLVVELLPGWISRETLRHALMATVRQLAVSRQRILRTLMDLATPGVGMPWAGEGESGLPAVLH